LPEKTRVVPVDSGITDVTKTTPNVAEMAPEILARNPQFFETASEVFTVDPRAAETSPDMSVTGQQAATTASAVAVTTAERITELSNVVAKLTGEVASLRQRLETISTFERLHDVVLSRYPTHPYSPPSSSRLEARDFMESTEGIYFLEYTHSGVAFRWTGPGHFTRFTFFVDRSVPVRVRLNLFSLGRISNNDPLSADIDGITYLFTQTDKTDQFVAGPVPPRTGERRTDVILHVPVLFSPEDKSGDSRQLGVAVTSITLEPAA
jgi:hypothetical protein